MKRFSKILFLIAVLTLAIAPAFLFAATDTTAVVINSLTTVPTQSTLTLIVTILTPLVVYGATWVIGTFLPKIPSVLITTLVVPVLSGVAALIATLLGSTNPWYIQLALGFAATFVHEFQNNVGKALPPAPPKV